METNNSKNLRTVKKASQETGASQSYFRQLIREGVHDQHGRVYFSQ